MKTRKEKFSKLKHYKIILFLVILYIIIDCACNVVLYKVVQVGPLIVPAGIFIYPLIFLIGDIIAEIYGYKFARLVVIYDLFFNLLFAVLVDILIYLPSPKNWHLEASYVIVLGSLIRANISVIIGVLIGNVVNIYFISRWKIVTMGRFFWLRSIGSSLIGEAVMLVLFVFLLYIGRLPMQEILKIIPSDYLIRFIYAILGSFPATLVVNYLKRHGEQEIENEQKETLGIEWNFNK